MAAWQHYKIHQPVSDRHPDWKSSLVWQQREVHPFLQQVRKVLNWAVDYLGLVGVDDTDAPGTLDAKLLVSTGLTKTTGGAVGARTLTLGVDPSTLIYDFSCYTGAGLLASGATIYRHICVRSSSLPVNLTGSRAKALVAPMGSQVITIKKNGASVATCTFAGGSDTGSFVCAAEVTLADGDLLTFHNQAVADATFAGLTVTLKGTR